MYRVTCHRVVGDHDGTFISNEPNLTEACRIVTAIFEALKIVSGRPIEMRQRVIPVGAAIEIFATDRTGSGYTRNNFIAYFRCQELPGDEREK